MEIIPLTSVANIINDFLGVVTANILPIIGLSAFVLGISFTLALFDQSAQFDDTEGGKYWRSKFTGKRYRIK